VGIIDVDLLPNGYGSPRRPDYVPVASSCGSPVKGSVRFLECKGTSNPKDSRDQYAKAVEQIAIPLRGHSAPGIAVSTVTGPGQVSYVALELTGRDEEEPRDADETPRRRHDAHAPDAPARPGHGLIPDTLRSSWLMLGHYGGNQAAVQRWSESEGKRVGMVPAFRGARALIESELGPAIGTTTTFDLGDRQLVATWAIDRKIDDALTYGRPEDVLTAQEEFATELDAIVLDEAAANEPKATADQLVPGVPVESVMPDGSIFSLTVR
jgi:hypothetical protein